MIYDFISVTEAAAIAAFAWAGMGNEKAADQAAVEAMRRQLNTMAIDGIIIVGEGERDKAPMLYCGERVGRGGKRVEIAVDPLEGTSICARGLENSIAVIAIAFNNSSFLKTPDIYMDKIAVGANIPKEAIDLDVSVAANLNNIADAKGCDVSELYVSILKRERHKDLIEQIHQVGARIHLLDDCDIEAVINTCMADSKVDVYMGIGGAPEGILAAAAIKALGGQIKGRLIFNNQHEIEKANHMGIIDLNKQYSTEELAIGNDIVFIATGVTGGQFIPGIEVLDKAQRKFMSTSILISTKDHTINFITREQI